MGLNVVANRGATLAQHLSARQSSLFRQRKGIRAQVDSVRPLSRESRKRCPVQGSGLSKSVEVETRGTRWPGRES